MSVWLQLIIRNTGNEGATVDKQYNWAALLLCPTRLCTGIIGMKNMVILFKQDVDAGKRNLENVARDIMRDIHTKIPSVQSFVSFLQALQVIADTKLIAEMLDVVASIKESYSINSFISDASFCDLVVSIGHKHGWDILKSPLLTMFTNCSSSNVEKYCTFLKTIASKKL